MTHTAEEIARVRAEIRAQQDSRTRKRIIALRAANRTMPVKEIAFRAGVSAGYVEQVLAQAAGPRPKGRIAMRPGAEGLGVRASRSADR